MIKNLTGCALFVCATAFSQVGVNTNTPKTTMDVTAKRDASGNITDNGQFIGLQAPRLTRAELTANTATYGTDQKAALVYITDISGGDTAGQRANIDVAGYYYFDGAFWQKFSGSEVDGVIGNEVLNATTNGGLVRGGAGTTASPYTLGLTSGSATGQVMTWNNATSTWSPATPGAVVEADGVIGNEVLNATTNGGLIRGGAGTTASPYTLGLTSGSATGQVMTWDNTTSTWSPANPVAEVDGVIGNEVLNATTNGGLVRGGSGTTASPYTLGLTSGSATGQVMTWNNATSTWSPTSPAAEVDGVIGNEVLNATTNGGLVRGGSGTTASPYTLGLTSGSATGQVMTWDNATSTWSPTSPAAEVDGVIGNEVLNATTNGGLVRGGAGTTASPYTLGLTNGSATGDLMTWNGTSWAPSIAKNIYTIDGTLTGNRKVTQSGSTLTFSDAQKTTFTNSTGVGFVQDSGSGTRASIGMSNGGTAQLWFFSDSNSQVQLLGTNTATGLSLGTNTTNSSAPITFVTSSGSGAAGNEKMRITGDGNVGINTSLPSTSARLHVVAKATDLTPAIIVGCPTFTDNTAATSAGIPIGGLYRKADGTLMVTY